MVRRLDHHDLINLIERGRRPASRAAGRFRSPLRNEKAAAWLGAWLGISFTVALATGVLSHYMQHPPDWLRWPARPVSLYRITQGVHVIAGLATVPLLLAKLWTVYPKLWQWPPLRGIGHASKRGFIFLLVGGALFELVTGLFNIAYLYPFPFFFPAAHYWTGYLVYGALIIHVVNEWTKTRTHLLGTWRLAPIHRPRGRTRTTTRTTTGKTARTAARTAARDAGATAPGRRGFFAMVAAACGIVALTTVGEAFPPLAGLAVLAPRRPGRGPQGLPVNKSAVAAGVTAAARDPSWRLVIAGDIPRELTLAPEDLRAMPRRVVRLPISCVEGWSADGTWAGVRLRDVLARAGAPPDATVRVESLQRTGRYRASVVDPPHWRDPDTLLAYELNGEPLALDHGYPCRLIAPNRPGVLQTKWIARLVVS